MKIATVDAFVRQNVLPEHRAIIALIRKMMRELAPEARETISYGIPVWKGNKIFAFISSTRKDITFAFSRGTEFEDKYHLLHGAGKVSRHVKMADLKDVNRAALRYYIKQALKIDRAK